MAALFRSSVLGLFALVITLVFPGTSSAKDILHVKTFLISPWGLDEGGNHSGITYDMAQVIAQEADLGIENEVVPFARYLEAVTTGESDIGIMHRTPDSEAIAEPLGRTMVDPEIVVFPRKGLQIRSLDDVRGLTLGVTRGGLAIQDERLATDTTIKVVEYKTDEQGIEMLKLGRLDGIVSSKEASFFLIRKKGFSPADFGEPFTLSTKEGNVMFARNSKNQHLKERVRAAVESLQKKGTFLQIRKKYLGY